MGRRADGELEMEILQILWECDGPLQTADVQERLSGHLAYTSVATVLSRLTTKGLVNKEQVGRSFAYVAAITRQDWYAARMLAVLHETPDHRSLLAGFVDRLSKKDREALRTFLSGGDKK